MLRLAEDGARVVASSRTLAHVEETCAVVPPTVDVRPEAVALDVTDRARVDTVVEEVIDRHGGLDVLVLDVGVDLAHAPLLEATTDEDWDHLFRVNVTGMFTVLRAALPRLARGASIVTVGSINSLGGVAGRRGLHRHQGGRAAADACRRARGRAARHPRANSSTAARPPGRQAV